MMNAKSNIKEWSNELKNDAKHNYENFLRKYFNNQSFYTEFYKHLGEKSEYALITECLYNMSRSNNKNLQVALLDLLPLILKYYLISSHNVEKTKKPYDDIIINYQSCLTSIYNWFKQYLNSENFHIDAYSKGSIFHQPIARPGISLLNSDIDIKTEKSTSSRNISIVIEGLIKLYVEWINDFTKVSLNDFCLLVIRICSFKESPRLSVPETTMKLLLNGTYCILFREPELLNSILALKWLGIKASHNLMTDIMLSVTSIQNSLNTNPSGHPLQGPIGISQFIRERRDTINPDSLITNANFKIEKIPEDIITKETNTNDTGQDSIILKSETKLLAKIQGITNSMKPLYMHRHTINNKNKNNNNNDDGLPCDTINHDTVEMNDITMKFNNDIDERHFSTPPQSPSSPSSPIPPLSTSSVSSASSFKFKFTSSSSLPQTQNNNHDKNNNENHQKKVATKL